MSERSLEARIAALEDIEAIRTLKWRYLRACDRKRPEDVRDCFLPDAAIDYQDQGLPPFADRDAFVAFYAEHGGTRTDIFDMHHGQNPVVELTGADTAVGTFDLYYYGIDTTSRTLTQMSVAYDDEFVRRDGRWWISRTVTRSGQMLVQRIDEEDGRPTVLILGEPTGTFRTLPPQTA